jgi:Holliday junction resolvase RusA-like endonuclease
MVKLLVSIPAEPIAQGRPRLSSRGGFARAYDPPKSRSWKAFVGDYAERAMKEAGIDTLMVSLFLKANTGRLRNL